MRPSAVTSKPSFVSKYASVKPAQAALSGSNKQSKEFMESIDDAFSPMLSSKPIIFGDLGVINETVPCSYMQPTKASLAAKKQKTGGLVPDEKA